MLRYALLLAAALLAGCAGDPDESESTPTPEEPVRNTTPPTDPNVTSPASAPMCVEGAPDCEDAVVEPAPAPEPAPQY